jgi:hypothetical protein
MGHCCPNLSAAGVALKSPACAKRARRGHGNFTDGIPCASWASGHRPATSEEKPRPTIVAAPTALIVRGRWTNENQTSSIALATFAPTRR